MYELTITLPGIEPAIWRRIQVPSTILLCCLHDAFQAVMGWTDSHLHQFQKDGRYWGVPDDGGFEDDIEVVDQSRVPAELGEPTKKVVPVLFPPLRFASRSGVHLLTKIFRQTADTLKLVPSMASTDVGIGDIVCVGRD
jgi:hypothetical protein